MENSVRGHILMPDIERENLRKQKEAEEVVFDKKTEEFLDYLFETYGVQETVVPGTEISNLFKEMNNQEQINNYIN